MANRVRIIASILIGLIGLAVLCAVLFFTVIFPKQTIDYIEINGLGEQVVLSSSTNSYIEGLKGLRYSDIEPEVIEDHLLNQGFLESVTVIRKYPGNLYIDIIPKRIVGFITLEEKETHVLQEFLMTDDQNYHIAYNELISHLSTALPRIEILLDYDSQVIVTEVILDAFRYFPMISELKEAAPDIYNLISEVKYDTNNNRVITIGLIYTGVHMDFQLFDPTSGVRLEEAIRAAITIGRGDTSDTSFRYKVFDSYMVESVI